MKTNKAVESIRHKDKRANIPAEEPRDFVADEEHAPKTVRRAIQITRRGTPYSHIIKY